MVELSYTLKTSSRRRRTVAFRFDPVDGLVVLAPPKTPRSTVERLLHQYHDRIAARLAARPRPQPVPPLHGSPLPFLGQELIVQLEHSPLLRGRAGVQRNQDTLLVMLPPGGDENLARAALRDWLKRQAENVLQERTAHYAHLSGLVPRQVLIRDQRARWGSCAVDNTIRYNWRLVMLPLALLDYVVVHELAHIREKNHSPAFWAVVAGMLPDWRERRRGLRQVTLPAGRMEGW